MRSVQIRIRGDHLRLKPDAKLHAKFVDLVHQIFQTALKLLLIDCPVAKRAVITVASAKPAVIHDKHLYAKFRCLLRNGQQFVGVELKIRRLPVIDENRTLFILIFTTD